MRSIRHFRHFLTGTAATILLCGTALGDDGTTPVQRNNYGVVGMIDMPSARVAPDGELAVGGSFFKNTQLYNFDFQVTPWLDGSFLYSGLTHYLDSYPVYWDRAFSMKARLSQEGDILPAIALGINDGVGTGIYSGEYLVASKAIGPVDATLGIGWGRLGTAATFSNPLGAIFNSYKSRPNDENIGQTNGEYFKGPAGVFGGLIWRTPIDHLSLIGEFSSDSYQLEQSRGVFKPANQLNFGASYEAFDSVTFGLNWMYGRSLDGRVSVALDPVKDPFPVRLGPTLPPLHLRTEEEQQQALNNLLDERSGALRAASIAASNRNAMVDALWKDPGLNDVALNGRLLEVRFASGDPVRQCQTLAQLVGHFGAAIDSVDMRVGGKNQKCAVPTLVHPAVFGMGATELAGLAMAPPSLLTIDAAGPAASPTQAIDRIRADLAIQQITVQAASLTGSEAIVYYENLKYPRERDAIDRMVRVLLQDAPPAIEKFRLVPVLAGVPQNEYDILRGPTERDLTQNGRYSLFENGNQVAAAPMENPVLADAERGTYPRFSYVVFPQFRQEFFDPTNPFAVQFLAGAAGFVELFPGLQLIGEGELNIYDNFNTARGSDSVLPHVRTDWAEFFTEGKNGIGELDLHYNFRLAPDVFALVKAGYLESMFAGAGGEVLWHPEDQRWALGVDLYDVQQRGFTRLFSLQSYRAFTGHVSVYYDSPWYGLNFAVRAGQYLAGDRGYTMEVSRVFPDTGVEIGAFFTRTNVSATQFGEGSFDKGFTITIPIGWTLPVNTQAFFSTVLRPLQRDGGQRLEGDVQLYEQLRRTNYGTLSQTGDIVVP